MANYDSDSSDEAGNNYTTTNVVLGYASNESSGDDVSHIGGHPVWLDSSSKPSASLAKCKVCNDHMSLLLQLNADLLQHFPNDQRRLQVWNCRKRPCSRKPGSIRAFREIKKGQQKRQVKAQDKIAEQPSQPKETGIGLGNALFGGNVSVSNGNANPFSTSTTTNPTTNNIFGGLTSTVAQAVDPSQILSSQKPLSETFAEKLKIGSNTTTDIPVKETWPSDDDFTNPYPSFYLDAYPEELDLTPSDAGTTGESSKIRYDTDETSSSALEKDTFESSLDKTFQRFSDIVAQNPEQVLRYEFKGQPLLYSGSDGVASRFVVPHGKAGAVKGMPRCEKCGSQRAFEMQLTPNLIYEIEKDEATDIDSGMEWGAIIVGTCSNNCGEEGAIAFREEWVGVQWEERINRK